MPGSGSTGFKYTVYDNIMSSANLVSDFTGLNLNEVLELPHDVFVLILRNSIVKKLSSTEKGRESLRLWEIYNTTEPDYAKIRNSNIYRG